MLTDQEIDKLANKYHITTKNGLLYCYGDQVDLPLADNLARTFGFDYAERLVKHLEKREVIVCE
ncbi:hypothetical protein LCGC14_1609930 [marine sediment metagenome]|uniref:Uncharacterized protein n=1 Tax=marine sediment metagenome TaxID=412755 RepID=A0A0F9I8M0_9ZZZZ